MWKVYDNDDDNDRHIGSEKLISAFGSGELIKTRHLLHNNNKVFRFLRPQLLVITDYDEYVDK